MRVISCSLSLLAAHAFRMDSSDILSADADLSEHLFTQENATINKICHDKRFWPPALASKYANGKMVGSGATACVAIADFKGTKVAIKVGKKGSNLKEWKLECADMKRIRLNSCKNKVLDMHEQYIPTCLDVGQVEYNGEKVNYYVMHAAAVDGISQVGKSFNPDVKTRKNLGAQVVASIYAMHKAGYAHNDLHGNNIVVDQKKITLQLIDLGDAANYPGWIKDYKRDSNAVWRWLGVLADCPREAQWFSHIKGRKNVQTAADNFKQCMKDKWNTDEEFNKALEVMLNGCVKNLRVHNVDKVFNTKFIQSNLPPVNKLFPSDHTAGCTGWDEKTWQEKEFRAEFGNHYKCDTIPTYSGSAGAGKKKKSTVQCARGRPHKSGGNGHCFTTKGGVGWGCAGAIDWDGFKDANKPCNEMGAPGGGMYEGGCLTPDHPGYFVTKDWSR